MDITIDIRSHTDNSIYPKQYQLLNRDLTEIRSGWFNNYQLRIQGIEADIYMLKVSFASGVQFTKVLDLLNAEQRYFQIDFSTVSPREAQEWAYFTKSALRLRDKSKKEVDDPRRFSVTTWTFRQLYWEGAPVEAAISFAIRDVGENITIEPRNDLLNLLEISSEHTTPIFVCIPLQQKVHCLLKHATGPVDAVHPVDVTVATEHWQMEALLNLLTTGDMEKAASLFGSTGLDMMAVHAEQMLYEKRRNPAAACVGGYYLLRAKELDRLHDWANNLANWFPEMADGCIIHAWQLLLEGGKRKNNYQRVKERLLQAIARGIPVYTEGLRLLHEGLCMLYYANERPEAIIEQALKLVKQYMEGVDWSKGNMTFSISALPDHSLFTNFEDTIDGSGYRAHGRAIAAVPQDEIVANDLKAYYH